MQTLAGRVNNEMQTTVTAVGVGAKRQAESVKMMAELERQAANIGDIVKAVARIADQTNLLALNAAIEATRAGQHAQAVPAELRQDGLVALRYQPEPECFFKVKTPGTWHLAPGPQHTRPAPLGGGRANPGAGSQQL